MIDVDSHSPSFIIFPRSQVPACWYCLLACLDNVLEYNLTYNGSFKFLLHLRVVRPKHFKR